MDRLNFLSQDEVKSIHETTLRILSEVGYVWTHKESLDILTGAGCTIKGNRVYFPPELVEDSIKKSGKRATVTGRGGTSLTLGDGNLYFHNLGGARDVYDAKTNSRRSAEEQDVIDATRLLDALENCHTVTPFFTPQNVSGELMSLYMYRHSIPHTTKPLQGPGIQYAYEVKYALEMAAVIGVEPVSVDSFAVTCQPAHDPRPRSGSSHQNGRGGDSFRNTSLPHRRRNIPNDHGGKSGSAKRRDTCNRCFVADHQPWLADHLLRTACDA